ncbi:hypothetical protein A6A22_16235 [Arthrobacter sp. OY3WO11]|nr:hypothetical protein A6A22_16235 [Arthrobacter sp. OY3WO11]
MDRGRSALPVVEAEPARAPVGEQAAVVIFFPYLRWRNLPRADQAHRLTTVDVRGQHPPQLRVFRPPGVRRVPAAGASNGQRAL